jgi:lipopolysaccharide transport system ATP-binding protein
MIDLKFAHVSKRYFIQPRINGNHGNLVKRGRILPYSGLQEFWALRDVSFEVQTGEALGMIGCNGAGKSTVLKLLSRVSTPTHGEILINGRLSALIEVGSGFHPELTGRENIYLSGSILGMRRREIRTKLDSIIEFSEIKDFIDTPVKRYSSGMYVRLGFAIAAHLDPDILLLDEVLAVGDAGFQSKCLERIRYLQNAGTTIIFVSHDLEAVRRLCDRVLLLQGGQIVASGPAQQIIKLYSTTAAAEPCLSVTSDLLCFL